MKCFTLCFNLHVEVTGISPEFMCMTIRRACAPGKLTALSTLLAVAVSKIINTDLSLQHQYNYSKNIYKLLLKSTASITERLLN